LSEPAPRGSSSDAAATSSSPTSAPNGPGMQRVLGLFDCTMIVMGCIVGAGVFRQPAEIARSVGSLGGIVAVWGLGGVIALTGAFVFGELAAMFPKTGGEYVFVREPFGTFPAFMFGWLLLAAIVSAAVAYVAGVFTDHLDVVLTAASPHTSLASLAGRLRESCGHWTHFDVWPRDSDEVVGKKSVAIALVAALAWLNIRGVKLGARVQNAAMVAKLVGIAVVILLGVIVIAQGKAFPADGAALPLPSGGSSSGASAGTGAVVSTGFFAGFTASIFKAMFTYGGWQNVTAVGSEVKRPERTLPLSIVLGTVCVVAIYLAFNTALVAILGVGGVASSATPTADAAARVVHGGGLFVAGLVALSTFAITQALLLVTPRIYYAMAQDGLFFSAVGKLHPRYGTPHVAIALQALATIVHVVIGSMLNLSDMATFFDWLGFSLCGAGLFVLRWKRPNAPRPYRAFGYPWIPALFLGLAIYVFVGHLFVADDAARKRALWIFLAGLVVYAVFRFRRRSSVFRVP
jgi:APA family basic amino acid/polyamine antiporter